MLQILKNYIGLLIIPVIIYAYLKRIAHDTTNYYSAYLTVQKGSVLDNKSNILNVINNINDNMRKYKTDVLGRRNAQYYHLYAPGYLDINKKSAYEIYYYNYFIKRTKAGRGEH
jgi:hypothetical protein